MVAILLAALLVPGVASFAILRLLGAGRTATVRAALVAGAATVVLGVVVIAVVLGECLNENGDSGPPSYPWSPQREFCGDGPTPVWALLVLPTAITCVAALLFERGRRAAGWLVGTLMLVLPFLPWVYANSLETYPIATTPILHDPLLRQASESEPARACFLYGVQSDEPATQFAPATTRTCLEFDQTPEAAELTGEYDEGHTIGDLRRVAYGLTEEGMPVEPGDTDADGLEVVSVYELPDSEARIGSTQLMVP